MKERLTQLLEDSVGPNPELERLEPHDHYLQSCRDVCDLLAAEANLSHICMYTSGISSGKFVQVAQLGSSAGPAEVDTNAADYEPVRRIFDVSFLEFETLKARGYLDKIGEKDVGIFYLYSRGEIFGFFLYGGKDLEYSQSILAENAPLINLVCADSMFSFRLTILGEYLPADGSRDKFEKQIGATATDIVARAFGADGSTLRLIRPNRQLEVIGASGVYDLAIIQARHSGELLSGRLLASEEFDWAAVITSDSGTRDIGGLPVDVDLRGKLKEIGLFSVLMCKLVATSLDSTPQVLGTISYFFRRVTQYSRRDVAMFQDFSHRLAAYIALYFALLETQEQKRLGETQGRALQLAELTNLLSHDIWHKTYNLQSEAAGLEAFLEKAVGDDRIRGSENKIQTLMKEVEGVAARADELFEVTNRYRAIARRETAEMYKISNFSLSKIIRGVAETLGSVLSRKQISFRLTGSQALTARGPMLLFEQVIFNLVINSIEAIGQRRNGEINVSVQQDIGGVIVRVSDNGPGISHVHFPNLNEVFDIGRTSKTGGSGSGLFLARQIIGTHFKGNILLTSRQPALFSITLPPP